jgi:hypothetical protein
MNSVKIRFDDSILKIRNLHSLFLHLTENLSFNELLAADILRSEIVYAVGALDRFVHDLVLEGIMEIYTGRRAQTDSFRNITINLNQHQILSSSAIPEFELKRIIVEKHQYQAFQEPDKITSPLSLIWNEPHKWQKIAQSIGQSEQDVKVKLKNIVIRRNQIVHESDLDLFTGLQTPILNSDVEDSVNFIDILCGKIFDLVT